MVGVFGLRKGAIVRRIWFGERGSWVAVLGLGKGDLGSRFALRERAIGWQHLVSEGGEVVSGFGCVKRKIGTGVSCTTDERSTRVCCLQRE